MAECSFSQCCRFVSGWVCVRVMAQNVGKLARDERLQALAYATFFCIVSAEVFGHKQKLLEPTCCAELSSGS